MKSVNFVTEYFSFFSINLNQFLYMRDVAQNFFFGMKPYSFVFQYIVGICILTFVQILNRPMEVYCEYSSLFEVEWC